MEEDYRLKNIHSIQNEKVAQKSLDFLYQSPLSQVNVIIEWLCNQLKFRIKENRTPQRKVLFNELNLPSNILNIIQKGDDFYNNLINTEEWISKDSTDLINEKPFTYSLTRVYNQIWGIQNEHKSIELSIYNALQKYLIELLGESVAHDSEYNTIEIWENIHITTYSFDGFYNRWLNNIDVNLIIFNLNNLIYISSKIQLHDLASFMDYRREKEKHTQAYLEKLKNLESKSDWEFVRESTKDSDLLNFEDNLYLKENLILRTSLKNWIKWVDNLKFSVLQDHAFYSIKNLDSFREIISAIISEKSNLKTKSERLLLIALKKWFRLLENITSNLFYLKSGEWSGNFPRMEGKEDIIKQAENDYTDWTNNLLEEQCTTIFELIFKTAPVYDSIYFQGVFEWINSYTRQNYLNKKYPEPDLKTLEIVTGKFQSLLCADIQNKDTIIDCIEQTKLSWQFLESFLGIFMVDENDESFKEKLFLKYLSFIESSNFKWNISNEYNNETLDQACYFAYVISKQSNPFETWGKLYQEYKCWHEGWNYNVFSSKNKTNIENYLLTVGVCLSYTFYKNNEQIEAKSTFEKILNILFSQYRVSGKYKLTEYTVPLRFLSHTKAYFCSQEIDDFVAQLSLKIDEIKDLLPIYYEICFVLKEQQKQLNETANNHILSDIANNFWMLEIRYKDNTQKQQLQYFSELKKEINNFLNAI